MKLSKYAKELGVDYRTGWNWFKAGKIDGAYQTPTGTVIVPDIKTEQHIEYGVILYARTRGENKGQLVVRHVLRNIALPAVTLQFASFSELFGGMTLAENVFSYPGLGTATTAAAMNGDVPLLLGISLFTALFVFAGNLIANILYGIFDPRIREGR